MLQVVHCVSSLWAHSPLCRQLCVAHDRTQHAESPPEGKKKKKSRRKPWGEGTERLCCWVGGEFTYIQVCSSVKPILIHHTERWRRRTGEGGRGRGGCSGEGRGANGVVHSPKTRWMSQHNTKEEKKERERERERERGEKVVISHPCSMQRKYNFHLSSTTETKNIKQQTLVANR